MKEQILSLSLKNLKEVGEQTKQRIGRWGCELLGLAKETVKLSKPYRIESDKGLIFDFREDRFRLFSITNYRVPELDMRRRYGSRPSQICVGGFFRVAENGWYGKTISREKFGDEICGIWPYTMDRRYITQFIKGKFGEKVFGYNDSEETVTITYIPIDVIYQ